MHVDPEHTAGNWTERCNIYGIGIVSHRAPPCPCPSPSPSPPPPPPCVPGTDGDMPMTQIMWCLLTGHEPSVPPVPAEVTMAYANGQQASLVSYGALVLRDAQNYGHIDVRLRTCIAQCMMFYPHHRPRLEELEAEATRRCRDLEAAGLDHRAINHFNQRVFREPAPSWLPPSPHRAQEASAAVAADQMPPTQFEPWVRGLYRDGAGAGGDDVGFDFNSSSSGSSSGADAGPTARRPLRNVSRMSDLRRAAGAWDEADRRRVRSGGGRRRQPSRPGPSSVGGGSFRNVFAGIELGRLGAAVNSSLVGLVDSLDVARADLSIGSSVRALYARDDDRTTDTDDSAADDDDEDEDVAQDRNADRLAARRRRRLQRFGARWRRKGAQLLATLGNAFPNRVPLQPLARGSPSAGRR